MRSNSHPNLRVATLRLSLAGLALAGILVGGSAMMAPSLTSATTTASSSRVSEPPTKVQIEVELHQVGITPESLAAAGANQAQVTAIVRDMKAHVIANIEAIRTAEVAWGDRRNALDRLQRLVDSGRATQEDVAAYATAQTAFAAAATQRASIRTAIFNSGIENLTAAQREVIATLTGNVYWDMPIQYRAANREQADWVGLRDALAQQRIATHREMEVPPDAAAMVAAANADPAVSAAAANLQGLSLIQLAWDQALDN